MSSYILSAISLLWTSWVLPLCFGVWGRCWMASLTMLNICSPWWVANSKFPSPDSHLRPASKEKDSWEEKRRRETYEIYFETRDVFHNYSSGEEDRALISHEESMQMKFNMGILRNVYTKCTPAQCLYCDILTCDLSQIF